MDPGLGGVLAAMVTPAVLISASGMLIMSTSNRLARVIDRLRSLSREMEALASSTPGELVALRWSALEEQLELQTHRGRLVQTSLTSFYVALGCFVTTSALLAAATLEPRLAPFPPLVAIAGTLILLLGSVMLIRETALALRSIDSEMQLVLQLRERHRTMRGGRE